MRISDWSSDVCSSDLRRRSWRLTAHETGVTEMVGPEPLAIAFRSHNTKMRNVVRYGNPNLRLAKRSDLPPRASEDAPSLGKPSRTLEAHSNRSRVARLLDPPATARTSAECEIELHWRCGRSSPQTHEYARDPAPRL